MIIPYRSIPQDDYLFSDAHRRDPDGNIIDQYGNSGNRLADEFLGHPAIKHSSVIRTISLGDYLNYPSRRALLDLVKRKIIMPSMAVVGNHDLDMLDGGGYEPKDRIVFGGAIRTVGMHGHQAQSLWDPDKKVARRSVGQWIVRLGDAMEQVIPWSDEAFTTPAGVISKLPVIPRGWKDGRPVYLEWGASVLEKYAARVLVHGHDHEPGVFEYRGDGMWVSHLGRGHGTVLIYDKASCGSRINPGSLIVDTGSFMPSHRDHPHGWYRRGEVAPFVWGRQHGVLYRVCQDGLDPYVDMRPTDRQFRFWANADKVISV